LVNSDFVGAEQADEIVARWAVTQSSWSLPEDLSMTLTLSDSTFTFEGFDHHPGTSVFTRQSGSSQCRTLFRRQNLIFRRDPSLYVGRMFVFLITNSFFAIIYWHARQRTQQYVLARFFLMGWLGSTPTVFSVVAVYTYNQQFKLISKEVKNGLVSACSYVLATTLLEAPYMVILAMFAILIPFYVLAAGNVSGLVGAICIMTALLWCYECLAQCIAVVLPNAPLNAYNALFLDQLLLILRWIFEALLHHSAVPGNGQHNPFVLRHALFDLLGIP